MLCNAAHLLVEVRHRDVEVTGVHLAATSHSMALGSTAQQRSIAQHAAGLCYAMLRCYAMLCDAMLRYAMAHRLVVRDAEGLAARPRVAPEQRRLVWQHSVWHSI